MMYQFNIWVNKHVTNSITQIVLQTMYLYWYYQWQKSFSSSIRQPKTLKSYLQHHTNKLLHQHRLIVIKLLAIHFVAA